MPAGRLSACRGERCEEVFWGASCRGPEGAPLVGIKAGVQGVPVGTGHEESQNVLSLHLEDAVSLCRTHFGSHELSPWPESEGSSPSRL